VYKVRHSEKRSQRLKKGVWGHSPKSERDFESGREAFLQKWYHLPMLAKWKVERLAPCLPIRKARKA
jgi:hypothetical protein